MDDSQASMLSAEAECTEAAMQVIAGASSGADLAAAVAPNREPSMHAAQGHDLEGPKASVQQEAAAAISVDVVASKPAEEEAAEAVAPAPKLTVQQACWAPCLGMTMPNKHIFWSATGTFYHFPTLGCMRCRC